MHKEFKDGIFGKIFHFVKRILDVAYLAFLIFICYELATELVATSNFSNGEFDKFFAINMIYLGIATAVWIVLTIIDGVRRHLLKEQQRRQERLSNFHKYTF
jgi:hypothetical protein